MNPSLVTVGTINGGATEIKADVTSLGSAVAVTVLLSTNYTLANPRPPGFPTKPGLTGAAYANLDVPGMTLNSGTTVAFLKAEADALVTAGAGSYA